MMHDDDDDDDDNDDDELIIHSYVNLLTVFKIHEMF